MHSKSFFKAFISDPRHFQILTLACLVGLQMFWSDFGPSTMVVVLSVGGCCVFQYFFSRYYRLPVDLRSAFISGCSLSILLKSSVFLLYPLAAFIAIGSKFLIRYDNKHIFNPTNIAIVALLILFPSQVWISPGQWGSAVWLVLFLCCMGFLVLYKIPRRDIAFMFLACWSALLFLRASWLGDPISIPIHQIESGALLIFCFFMISDPKTSPDTKLGRFIFALLVALIAYIMQFEFQVRGSLLCALSLMCIFRPILDSFWGGTRYHWGERFETPIKRNEALGS